jgi:transglutaminase-like putative cysteine protease
MHLDISHQTRLDFDREFLLGPHLFYLRQRENPLLRVREFRLELSPSADVDWMRDDFDNLPASVLFSTSAAHAEIRATCSVTTADVPPFDFLVRDYAISFPFAYEALHRFNLGIYLAPPDEPTQAALRTWLRATFDPQPKETVAWLFGLNQLLFAKLEYHRRDEPGIQPPLVTLELGTGTCRDYAVLFIALARTLGVAARFVSGYLFDPHQLGDSPGDMHAWVEVFIPGAGWRALDPTHGIFCDNAYVPVAHAVLAESVNPVQGSFFGPTVEAQLTTHVRVRRSDAGLG